MRRWPKPTRWHRRSPTPLVVDHDGVARTAASRRSTSTTAIRAAQELRPSEPTGVMIRPRAHREERAGPRLLGRLLLSPSTIIC